MRLFLFTCSLLFLFSCSQDPKEKAISDFIQTIDGVKTDMNFKLLEIKKEKTITEIDSFNLHEQEWKKDIENKLLVHVRGVSNGKRNYEKLKSQETVSITYTELAEEQLQKLNFHQKVLDSLSSDSTKISPKLFAMLESLPKSKKPLANIFNVKYSINNPLLNGVKQEIIKKFVFDLEDNLIREVE